MFYDLFLYFRVAYIVINIVNIEHWTNFGMQHCHEQAGLLQLFAMWLAGFRPVAGRGGGGGEGDPDPLKNGRGRIMLSNVTL